MEKQTFAERQVETYSAAIFRWGHKAQLTQCLEELFEFQEAVARLGRSIFKEINGRGASSSYEVIALIDELADVQIMLDQVRLIMGDGATYDIRHKYKLERLRKNLGLVYDEVAVESGEEFTRLLKRKEVQ